ncbi:ATP-binding cassette domain-containing protein [Ottowia thiooxydans]|uniref:ATP-binding cassette domain-containing protein n=1 Tax=Ottowia thiooxydans TaxID=219182 RepID=UPI000412B86E|nr:ATP-binding cassette domain-containing protein [Ottowia thiooxydans]
MAGSATPIPEAKKAKPARSSWVMLAERWAGGRDAMLVVIITTLLTLLPNIAMPAFTQLFVDMVLVKNLNGWLFPIVVGLLVASFIALTSTLVQQYFTRRVESHVSVSTSVQMFWRSLTAPILFFGTVPVGDVVSRLASVPRLASLASSRVVANLTSALLASFYIAILLLYSVPLGLMTAALSCLNVFVLARVNRKRGAANKTQLVKVGQSYRIALGGIKAIESLKAMNMERFFFKRQAELIGSTTSVQQRIDSLSLLLDLAPKALNGLNSALVLGLGAMMVIDGRFSVGELLAFKMFAARFAQPVQDLMTGTQDFSELSARLSSCNAVIHAPIDPLTQARSQQPNLQRLSGEIELRNVTFGFPGAPAPIIKDLSLTIRPGTRVVIVGASGGGKSTLGKIAMGLYQPSSGVVLYDGLPITEISRTCWAASVGYVSQDVQLFEGTVRENFTLGDDTLSMEAIREAAKDAEIDDVISMRTGGYTSLVAEDGSNFSGGQRQRIEIGRALVRKPRILFLDEASAALDTETEAKIDRNLRRRGCTCIIIAHRLSTLKDADEILVLDQGSIVERGHHDELVQANGRYAELIRLA